jgi:hypothetical protein
MRLAEVENRRIGYGSYHWFATAGEGSDWFVTLDAVDGPFAARHSYAVARRLADEGLEFVRAPQPATSGDIVVDVGEWLLSVWPWVDGRSTTSSAHASAADLAAVLRCVRRLHDFAALNALPELVEDWELSGRAELKGSLTYQIGGAVHIRLRCRHSCCGVEKTDVVRESPAPASQTRYRRSMM